MNLDLAQNGDQRYLWAEGVLKCSVGTTLFDLSDFADQSVAEAHCYCMNRTAIAEFNTVFDTAVQTVVRCPWEFRWCCTCCVPVLATTRIRTTLFTRLLAFGC